MHFLAVFWIVHYSITQILSSHHLNRLHSAYIYSGVFSCFFTAPVKCKSQSRGKYRRPSHPYLQFCFQWFQLSVVNCSPKMLNGKFQEETIHKFQIAHYFEYPDEVLHCPESSLCAVRPRCICATRPLVT